MKDIRIKPACDLEENIHTLAGFRHLAIVMDCHRRCTFHGLWLDFDSISHTRESHPGQHKEEDTCFRRITCFESGTNICADDSFLCAVMLSMLVPCVFARKCTPCFCRTWGSYTPDDGLSEGPMGGLFPYRIMCVYSIIT